MGPFSRGRRLLLFWVLAAAVGIISSEVRVKRQTTKEQESLLTVEWEGIQTGDHADSDVKGFLVEYRPEKEKEWQLHPGIIPYKGPNHQYRVQIPKLPTGTSYFVRIKVIDEANNVLVETPEIRAKNEIVSIKCENDDVTAPRHPQLTHDGQFSLAIKWDSPDCGSVGDYQVELTGVSAPFDIHRQTVTQPHVSVTNLLPGTIYSIRIRAVDRNRNVGPWSSEALEAKTKGEALSASSQIKLLYKTESEISIQWEKLNNPKTQYYDVSAVEVDQNSRKVERVRLPPYVNTHLLSGLKPDTKYEIGVIAIVDHEPRQVFRITASTASGGVETWEEKPQIVDEGSRHFTVHWTRPTTDKNVDRYVLEYRLPNETAWRSAEEQSASGNSLDFSVSLKDLENTPFYSVRIVAIGKDGSVVARTDEMTVGDAGDDSCIGVAGVPQDIRSVVTSQTEIRFTWHKPNCDESVAPIDGYEYIIYESSQSQPFDGASYVGNTAVTVTDLKASTSYTFRVRSRSGNGHSQWSTPVAVSTSQTRINQDSLNFYQLRIVLSPPNAYLVWTPLPHHTNHILTFKLAYKERGASQWTFLVRSPSAFRCPRGVADPLDFCFHLKDFFFGVHYMSTISYILDTGESSPLGTTLHFSLIQLEGYEQAANKIDISQPRIEQQGDRSQAYWSVQGNTDGIYGYQLDIRSNSEREWRQNGQIVRSESGQVHYRQALGSLPLSAQYFVRVRAVDDSLTTVATSPSTSFSVSCQVPLSPDNVRLDRVSDRLVRVSWNAVTDDPSCQTYFFITGTQNGQSINERVPGSERSIDIPGSAQGNWNVEVRAVNSAGSGPSSPNAYLTSAQQSSGNKRVRRSIDSGACDPKTDIWCRSGNDMTSFEDDQALVSAPRVSTRGNDLHVEWRSEGDGRGVYGYRIQFRSENSGWNPYGKVVPYTGDNMEYSQTLTGLQLGQTYYVHIQVLDRNTYVMYVSPEATAKSSCTPPSHPPSHLQVQAADATHVRVNWVIPPQSTWGCADISFEIQADEPRGQAPVTVGGGATSHVFNSAPNTAWSIKIRARNSAGHSAWTPVSQTKTPPGGELIIGPDVIYRQGNPIVNWRSKENSEDLIESFQLEWKLPRDEQWRQHRNPVSFSGSQRPYSVDLGELPKGQSYQVRIVARDPNRGTAFTSPVVNVQTQSNCRPPRRAPSNLQVSTIGPTQIRLQWNPLHESEWNCDRLWYVVKYSTQRNSGYKNLTNGENYVVFDSEPYTQWNFQVQAANPAGESEWAVAGQAQTQTTAPGPVLDMRAQPMGSDSLQITWRPPANPNGLITSYEITYQLVSRGMCDGNQDAPRMVSVSTTSYVLNGLYPHSKYRIGVAAKTQLAGERVSQEIQTDQAAPGGSPVYLRVDDVHETDASISWQAPPCLQTNGEITEYEYEVTPTDSRYTVQKTSNNIRGTKAQITNLQPQTRYNVKVRAYTARGPGPWSQDLVVQTTSSGNVQAPPYVKVVSTGEDNAHLLWQSPYPNPGYIDKYKCRYAPTGTQQYQEKQFPAVSPCQSQVLQQQRLPPTPPGARVHCGRIDNLRPEQSYDFQVAAHVQNQGWSPYSQPQRTVVSDAAIDVTSVTKTGGTDKSLNIAWDVKEQDKTRVVAFRIIVTPTDNSARPQTFNVDRATYQYRIDNLRPKTTYNVTVSAATQKMICGGRATIMATEATPLMALTVPPRIVAEEPTSITIEWDSRNRDASGFIIDYRLEGGAWQQYPRRITANPSQVTYQGIVDGLPTNTVVDLRVRVVSQTNEISPPSPEVRGRTKCAAPTHPPQGIRLESPSINEVRVSWARPLKQTWMCDQLDIEITYRKGNDPPKTIRVPGDQTEYTFPAEPNQRWAVTLRATNQMGSSPPSPEYTLTTPQGAPGTVRGLRGKALSPNEVHVQWLAPLVQRGTIVGYDISYRLKHRLACPEEEPRDVSREFVTIYNHKDLDYTITGLLPYSLYEIKVRARTTELGPEETVDVSTEMQSPSAPPLNLELGYALERSVSIQWEPVDCSQRHGHIVSYEYEILGQDDWAKLERQIANTSDLRVTIEGLTPYTKYIVRVKAYNSIGGGPNTENLDVMTAKANAPLPPQDLVVAQEGTDFFMVSWLPPYPPYGPHDAHKIRYQLLGTDKWHEVEKLIGDPALKCPTESPRFCFNATGVEPGSQYKVQVATRIEGGSFGPWSKHVIATTLVVIPDAPSSIYLINRTDHSLYIRWTPPRDSKVDVAQYRLTIVSLADPNDQKRTFTVDHPTLTYLFDDLNPDTLYNISIAAGGKRGFGKEIWTTYSTDPFYIPVLIRAPKVTPDGAHALDIEWNGVMDPRNLVKGYVIEIRTSESNIWSIVGGTTPHDPVKRTYLKKIEKLDADTLYIVRIKVTDKNERFGAASPEAEGRTGCAPPTSPPSNTNIASPSNTEVRVSWQSPPQSSWKCSNIRYRIEYVNGTGPRKQIELPSTSIEHLFDSKPNTKWTVTIQTINDAGESPKSKELTIITAEGAPGRVTDIIATPKGPTSIEVEWKKPIDTNGVITKYTIEYRIKSIGECGPRSSVPIEKDVRNEKQLLDGLTPDSTYEIWITAHTTIPGSQSEIVTATTEESLPTGAPLNVRTSGVTSSRADVTWNQPECEQRNGKIVDYAYELWTVSKWGENKTGNNAAERLTLDELTAFTEYKIRVAAINSVGQGPFSDWVPFTTQSCAPGPPTDLKDEGVFPHAIEISWLPPYPPNGIIDFYKIRYTPSGEANYKEVRVDVDRLECSDAAKKDRLCYRLSELEPLQEYTIQVAARTDTGHWSDWSDELTASTEEQKIPVLERELEVIDTKPNSITLRWEGLSPEQANHVVGYVLEYKSEADDSKWDEYNDVVKHRKGNNEYKVTVKDLETATLYFFRLRVVGKSDKRGEPGPETKAPTSCGKPEEPPTELKAVGEGFETVKLTWKNPPEDTWRCDAVVIVIEYVNTTSKGNWTIPIDAPMELIIPTVPGTKWEFRARTQTVEDNMKPQFSRWSEKVKLTITAVPGDIFVTVEPTGPREALLTWALPEKDSNWNYGVDITYTLVQLGGCTKKATGSHEPVTKLNVQEKRVTLDGLMPGSLYEVVVTPRRPPSLHSSIVVPKTVRTFRTPSDVPTGPPQNLTNTIRRDSELGFKWEPPECLHQNGNVTQYEYVLVGMEEWNNGTREGVTPRLNTVIDGLQRGSLYSMKVRAYTSEGPGPWSDNVEARTTGSVLGPPRELSTVHAKATEIQLTWLPPYPEKVQIVAYRLKYSMTADDSNPTEAELSGDELSCSGYKNSIITPVHLCTTVKNLKPATTYRFQVQAQSASGDWGEWSSEHFSTTRPGDDSLLGGSLKLLSAGHDNIRVKWTPPDVIHDYIDTYELWISVASELDQNQKKFTVGGSEREYHFRELSPVTQYNVTVQGLQEGNRIWFISNIFPTTDIGDSTLPIPPPTDLYLIEKSDKMLHVRWEPPEIFDPELEALVTHYRVTIAPFDPHSRKLGQQKNYTVAVPATTMKFEGLTPRTIYNITVRAGTDSGYGEVLWGVYSTLATGERHIIRLRDRTPASLTVEWDPVWGKDHSGYTLTAYTLHSVFPNVRIHQLRTFDVDASETHYIISGLNPSTVYNVTLKPKDHNEHAWGAYATLPPGWWLVKNLKQCDKTNFAVSMSWEPIEMNMASHYQVRYLRLKDKDENWAIEAEREAKELLCPKDGCGRLCYLVFNLPHPPTDYVFQVRAKVEGEWNRWRSAPKKMITSDSINVKRACCIVPPPYFVENIGVPETYWEVDISPAATPDNVTRYYVVVDARDPPGDTNWTDLTDKVTADGKELPYYVAASFNKETLPEPRKVRIGDGTVIGGYLNYPLIKGKKYNYEVYTIWNVTGAPLVGRIRDVRETWWRRAPWYCFVILVILCLLLLLCLCWLCCYTKRYRARKDHMRRTTNGAHVPLLPEEKDSMAANLRSLEARLDNIKGDFDRKGRGDFEEGYIKGYKDSKLDSGAARQRMDQDGKGDRFHEGYVKGLKDAGMTGMTTSMHNLAQRGTGGGYSSGFMQGYKDGNAGVFGDKVTPTMIARLDEQYPGQDDFKQGYVDGFREGASSRMGDRRGFEDSRRLQQSLTELTERLTSLERSKGDEIHSTKIYHVYNQQPELVGYSSTGQQLAHELEELSTSRRSTLRRHYTPGDYLKSDAEEGYNSLGRNRRSLSASALARGESTFERGETLERSRHASATGSSYITRAAAAANQGTDTYAKRYNYRSRSDLGSPRRYASQTLLDGSRPGPSTPHARRDALSTLQRELDTLSRSPDRSTPRGYTSDTAYDSVRSKARGYSNYDYDAYQSKQQKEYRSSAAASSGAAQASSSTTTQAKQSGSTSKHGADDGKWADDLIEIVSEPMSKTLERMRKYSNSAANVEAQSSGAGAGGGDEVIEDKYQRHYKEEHSSGPR